MIGELPTGVEVNGRRYALRTDFRDVLTVLIAFNDPELEDKEKLFICLYILYKNFSGMKQEDYEEAYKKAVWFIDCGEEDDGATQNESRRKPHRLVDWEQDERVLFSAVNSVAGFEVRSRKYIHWWTFMGYFMEIREGVYSEVLSLRQKKAKNKKLEKWEREFWNANKKLCEIKPKLTEEEKEKKARLERLLS